MPLLQGQLDYRELRGQTGPLVYPAGFVYIFSFLRWLTGGGDIRTAQFVFAVLYIATQAVVLWLYIKAKVSSPPVAAPNYVIRTFLRSLNGHAVRTKREAPAKLGHEVRGRRHI